MRLLLRERPRPTHQVATLPWQQRPRSVLRRQQVLPRLNRCWPQQRQQRQQRPKPVVEIQGRPVKMQQLRPHRLPKRQIWALPSWASLQVFCTGSGKISVMSSDIDRHWLSLNSSAAALSVIHYQSLASVSVISILQLKLLIVFRGAQLRRPATQLQLRVTPQWIQPQTWQKSRRQPWRLRKRQVPRPPNRWQQLQWQPLTWPRSREPMPNRPQKLQWLQCFARITYLTTFSGPFSHLVLDYSALFG